MPDQQDQIVTKDFDAFWAEKEAKGQRKRLRVKVLGEVHMLPGRPPLKILKAIQGILERGGLQAQVMPDEVFGMLNALYGTEAVEAWVEKGMDDEQLEDITEWTMDQYGLSHEPEKPDAGQESSQTPEPQPSGSESLAAGAQ